MTVRKTAEVHIRADDHVQRLTAALIREEVPFEVKPEPNGWWRVRAAMPGIDLQSLEQSSRRLTS